MGDSDEPSSSNDTPARSPSSAAGVHAAGVCVDAADATGRVGAEGMSVLVRTLEAACGELGCGGEARVRVVGDWEMSRLHGERLGDATTTDVLTFDLRDGAKDGAAGGDARELDVDLVLCVDEAARRAGELGHEVWRELALYAVHGVLHCLGYDDHDPAAAAAMHAEEDRVLTAIGVGPVYEAGGAGGAGRGER